MKMESVTVFILGCFIGSILNSVIFLLAPGGKGRFFSRLRCPFCQSKIGLYDTVPLLSFLFLKGRCRSCNELISWQYLLVELAMAGVSVVLYNYYGNSAYFFIYLIFFALLLSCSIIDIRYGIIPDSLIVTGCIAGIIGSFFTLFPGTRNSLVGLAVGIIFPLFFTCGYEYLRKKTVMGGGDIKFIGMIGAFVGWEPLGLILFYAAAGGVFIMLALQLTAHSLRKLPFVPFLSVGTILASLLPNPSTFIHIFNI